MCDDRKKERMVIMKKVAIYLFLMMNIISFGNIKDPFKDKKFDDTFKNVQEIFPGDFRCRFIIKQVLLRSFHEDNKNMEMIDTFNSSLSTYGRIIQEEGLFGNEKNPVNVTTKYYSKYCTIPKQEWLNNFGSPSLNKYFDLIKENRLDK